jgi:hypothetical protein
MPSNVAGDYPQPAGRRKQRGSRIAGAIAYSALDSSTRRISTQGGEWLAGITS